MPLSIMTYGGKPREISDREEMLVYETLKEFNQMQVWRSTFASQWEEVSRLIDPTQRNTFFYNSYNWPGQKKTQDQIDATGMVALNRFGAILDSLLTPRNMFWHGLGADDDYVNKQRNVRLYFENLTKTLFKYRYKPIANFSAQNQGIYRSLGAYGTGGVFVDGYDGTLTGERGLRYKFIPVGELFIRENHQGVPDGFIRCFRLTAEQAMSNPAWKDRIPDVLRQPLGARSQQPFTFLHRVVPRYDWEPGFIGAKGRKFMSLYISLEGKCLLSEGGYNSLPVAISRYNQSAGEVYGRGVAMDVLPALKTLNAEKATFLKQGHRIGDPVLFTADDGVIGKDMRPGALNVGGVSPEGRLLVQPLPTGNINITKEMMDEERSLINDSFLVTLFQVLTETPQMTATEVIERTNEKGILLAPTVGRQQSEYLGPLIEREIQVLHDQGLLPPMPPELQEAEGEYHVIYTSPLSKAMRAQEAAGFIRTLETVKELVGITGDPSLLDPFEFDTAVPGIAEIQSVPESWMASPQRIMQKRQARQQQMQRQQEIQEAPAKAAMMKAEAAQAKAGMTGGGTAPAQAPAQGGAPLASQMTGG